MREHEWNSIPYETRLVCTAYVLSKIAQLIGQEGGSFRLLIYDLLGFGPDAYAPLYLAGGMSVTNFINNVFIDSLGSDVNG